MGAPRLLVAALLAAAVGGFGGRAMAEDGPSERMRRDARAFVEERAGQAPQIADFPAGLAWLNVSRPLSFAKELKGKVVVLDFWCYCCINCMHVLPDLEHVETKYAGKAVAVVGVHSAKFLNEKETENIRRAVDRYEIRHPVVNDGDFKVWNAFGARSWPTLAVVSPDGRLLWGAAGEGHRDELDAVVGAALDLYGEKGLLDAAPLPIRLEQGRRAPAELAYPGKLAVDEKRGALFVADSGHHRVLELGLDGAFRRAWGDGVRGLVDGPPGTARFFRPQGLAVRGDELWVADTENHAIRRIDLVSGAVTTVAGTGKQGWMREGKVAGKTAELSSPWDLRFVGERLFVAMAGVHQLWTLDPATGEVRHFAGSGNEERRDGPNLARASFAQPSGLAWDGTSLYVADSESSSVVRVGLEGPVETLAGANDEPRDLFDFGDRDGVGHQAKLQHPLAVLFHEGLLWIADSYNHKVKSLDPKTRAVTTRWGSDKPGLSDDPPAFSEPGGLAALGKTLYVADTNNHAIRTVDLATGKVATLAPKGVPFPQAAARAGGTSGGWPEMPGTVRHELPPAKARPGATLRVRLDLPEGWHLTEGAPSALRVEGGPEPVERRVESPSVDVAIPKGASSLVVRGIYYVCEDAGSCRVRSVVWTLPLAEVPDGAERVEAVDTFRP